MFKTRYLMLLAALLMVPAIACGDKKDDSDSTPAAGNTSSTPEATRTVAGATPAAGVGNSELNSLVQGFSRVKSFRATLVVEQTGQARQEGLIETVLPDRVHIVMGGIEMISIGADSYLKVGPTWTRNPGGGIGNIFDVSDIADSIGLFAADSSVVKGGQETVAGKRCQIYNYSSAGTATELCIADSKPLRVVSNVGGAKTTLIFTDFDNVEVRAPI